MARPNPTPSPPQEGEWWQNALGEWQVPLPLRGRQKRRMTSPTTCNTNRQAPRKTRKSCKHQPHIRLTSSRWKGEVKRGERLLGIDPEKHRASSTGVGAAVSYSAFRQVLQQVGSDPIMVDSQDGGMCEGDERRKVLHQILRHLLLQADSAQATNDSLFRRGRIFGPPDARHSAQAGEAATQEKARSGRATGYRRLE